MVNFSQFMDDIIWFMDEGCLLGNLFLDQSCNHINDSWVSQNEDFGKNSLPKVPEKPFDFFQCYVWENFWLEMPFGKYWKNWYDSSPSSRVLIWLIPNFINCTISRNKASSSCFWAYTYKSIYKKIHNSMTMVDLISLKFRNRRW